MVSHDPGLKLRQTPPNSAKLRQTPPSSAEKVVSGSGSERARSENRVSERRFCFFCLGGPAPPEGQAGAHLIKLRCTFSTVASPRAAICDRARPMQVGKCTAYNKMQRKNWHRSVGCRKRSPVARPRGRRAGVPFTQPPFQARMTPRSGSTDGIANSAATSLPVHAVCITGLQRAFPRIAPNIRRSLASLYDAVEEEESSTPSLRTADSPGRSLGQVASFFGVRPGNDSWSAVYAHLPPLANETLQTPCGVSPPRWFSVYVRSGSAKERYLISRTFVQSLCDQADCMRQITNYEGSARRGRRFHTIARLRLDLAWEVPLRMPPMGLLAHTVHLPRMNAKAGVNDKWAIGLRIPMGVYLHRVHAIAAANVLLAHNKSAPSAGLFWMHSERAKGSSTTDFKCSDRGAGEGQLLCRPQLDNHTAWQRTGGAVEDQRKFAFTSEGFLQWSLWRHNISIAYESRWMFCKCKEVGNMTARTCVPRMRQATPCVSLVCTGGGVDCACHKERRCTSRDPKTGRNTTMWYCQDVAGRQLDLQGNLIPSASLESGAR